MMRLLPFSSARLIATSFSIISVLYLTAPHSAYAEENRNGIKIEQLDHEIKRLRRDLAQVQKEFYSTPDEQKFVRSNLPRGDISSQVELQLNEMEVRLREITGQFERTQHQISLLNKKLDDTANTLNSQIQALEKTQAGIQKQGTGGTMVQQFDTPPNTPINLNPATSDNKNATLKDEAEPKQNADELAFLEAKKLLQQAQYDAAALKFQQFIATYKDSDYLPEAYFWQGELFNIREELENAAVSFLKAYQSKPKGKKAGDSLLQLGGVLGNLNKINEACTTFKKAEKEFPKDATLKEKINNERQRLGCT